MNVFERDKLRMQLLVEIYSQVEGDTNTPFDFEEIAKLLNIDNAEKNKAYSYLKDEGLIDYYGAGNTSLLTHYGLKLVESIRRKIDFSSDSHFSTTEILQLRIILDELKYELYNLKLAQKTIYANIDEAFEKSKTETKLNWKTYFEAQIKDWLAQKIINDSAELIMKGLLVGLKFQTVI